MQTELMSGPIGPDTIRIPGQPAQLRNAVQGLRDLCRAIEQASDQLKQADPPDGDRGRIALALSRSAQRTARGLDLDSQQLGALADSIDHAAETLTQAKDGTDDISRRWRQARDVLRDVLRGRKNAPVDLEALIHRIDTNAADSHVTQFRRQAGLSFADAATGVHIEMAFKEGGPIDEAINAYRQTVRGLVDEYSDLMQKAKNADNHVDEKLPRHTVAVASMAAVTDDGGPEQHNVSRPAVIRSMGDQIQEAARGINQAEHRLEDIRLAIRASRMIPDDERVGSNDGFKRDWTEHFDAIRHKLNDARRAGDQAADRLRDADEAGAADVRQAMRDDD